MTAQITTVLATFRRPQLLKRAIATALSQSFTDIRVLVLDNNSGDETEEVVREFQKQDGRIIYHRQPENIGAYANYDFGLRAVETPYFSFFADDDLLLPDFYANAHRALQGAEYAFALTQVIRIGSQRTLVSRRPDCFTAGIYSPPRGGLDLFMKGTPVWTGILFRTDIRDTIGYLNTNIGIALDLDYILRASARFSFLSLASPGAIHLLDAAADHRTESLHHLRDAPAMEQWFDAIRKNYGLPPEVAEALIKFLRNRYAKNLYEAASRWALSGSFTNAQAALPILRSFGWQNIEVLERRIVVGRYVLPVRWFIALKEWIRRQPVYLRMTRNKRKRRYGDFLKYEDTIRTSAGS